MNDPTAFESPALHLALALAAGMGAQTLARHLRIPGIVLLLATGVVLGPDLLGVVRPEVLGDTLSMLVGFAVAVILFEGAMNLEIARLRHEARSIRQLVTLGALVTAAGGTIAARLFLGWEWRLAVLFGTLVIVTGPTVIGPLLRRVRLQRGLATVLEAEGVLIDPIGAIIAVVALEVVLHPGSEGLAAGTGGLLLRLGLGSILGALGGGLIAFALHFHRLVPEGLENVFTLTMVVVLYQFSDALMQESGIVTVTAAGMMVGNIKTPPLRELKEFKEQLTVMLIGMLFVLLAADVRIEEVRALGRGGVLTVAALMLVVRPLNVWLGTAGSALTARDKTFLSWMAPRGIVAAAVSSLFAEQLDRVGIEGGSQLRAMVFLVIAATVLIQGLSGGLLASLLGVRRPERQGFVILGANPLGIALANVCRAADEDVVLLDSNPEACRRAEERGLRVIYGNGLEEGPLARADVEHRGACLATTPSDEINLLFARRVRENSRTPELWVALNRSSGHVTSEMIEKLGARVLFGGARQLPLWMVQLERGRAVVEVWTRRTASEKRERAGDPGPRRAESPLLPLAIRRGRRVRPYRKGMAVDERDELHVVVVERLRDEAEKWLTEEGWTSRVPPDEAPRAADTGGSR